MPSQTIYPPGGGGARGPKIKTPSGSAQDATRRAYQTGRQSAATGPAAVTSRTAGIPRGSTGVTPLGSGDTRGGRAPSGKPLKVTSRNARGQGIPIPR
jgi:hypothetical protein